MGIVEYILWTYIPSVVAVLYGVLWAIIDGEAKRVGKYHQLAKAHWISWEELSMC